VARQRAKANQIAEALATTDSQDNRRATVGQYQYSTPEEALALAQRLSAEIREHGMTLEEKERRERNRQEWERKKRELARRESVISFGYALLVLPVLALLLLAVLGVLGVGARVIVGLARLAGG
jgi:anti-sigma factor RsiW